MGDYYDLYKDDKIWGFEVAAPPQPFKKYQKTEVFCDLGIGNDKWDLTGVTMADNVVTAELSKDTRMPYYTENYEDKKVSSHCVLLPTGNEEEVITRKFDFKKTIKV